MPCIFLLRIFNKHLILRIFIKSYDLFLPQLKPFGKQVVTDVRLKQKKERLHIEILVSHLRREDRRVASST